MSALLLNRPATFRDEVEHFIAGRGEVRIEEVREHLAAVGWRRSSQPAVASLLRSAGWTRCVRACGTVYLAPPPPSPALAFRPRHLRAEDFLPASPPQRRSRLGRTVRAFAALFVAGCSQ